MKFTHRDFKIGLIYCYTSPSGKKYIGQTINEKSRKNEHKSSVKRKDTYFTRAIRKYGFENFSYEVIIKFKPTVDIKKLKRVLDKLEKRYIKLYKTNNSEFGYNLTNGGSKGILHNEESIEKIREKSLNMTKEHREKLSKAAKARCARGLTEGQLKGLEKGRLKKTEEQKKNYKKVGKKVYKYDLKLNLIEEFDSLLNAADSIEDYNGSRKTKGKRIGECCSEKRKSIYGFIWRFEKF